MDTPLEHLQTKVSFASYANDLVAISNILACLHIQLKKLDKHCNHQERTLMSTNVWSLAIHINKK